MAIMNKLIPKKQKDLFSVSTSPPRYKRLSGEENCNGRVRKGYVPVMVGEEGSWERFLVPTHFLSCPVIVSLFESSVDEFGYRQEGIIQIPQHPDCFREILHNLSYLKKT